MAVKDLVSGVLAESITTSTTNILVTIAQNIGASEIQAFFPTPPFYITIMPKTPTIGVANRLDSEIIQVTAVGHDQVGNAALTGVRAQRDTTAKAFSAGDIVTVGSYCDDAVFLSEDGTEETETPWVNTNMIEDGAITPEKTSFAEYSTTEQVVGTWIDGKPLYRKVFSADTTAGGTLSVPIGTNDIDTVVKADVYKTQVGTTTDTVGSFYTSSTDYFRYWVRKTQHGVYQVELRSASNAYSYTMVIEYTKTTD